MAIKERQQIQAGYEPIKGYKIEKLLGRGGYGEVWQAEAPGGIKKAVKFVFGQHGEHRATQELKSLERIKGVQHPFLLTLERFEVIENQLVIVTELADGSLDEVFKAHVDRGSCGIPRDVLLGHMKDAADALDYLHQLYKLQHLDVKPANLLLVGGRVKVADFGLLKDLGEVDCSLVGGLTPIYAPPELFDGRPSLHSDQYSLAVMYQELLTGVRPFSGRTIAQLATQHVHNAPNLDPLPASDRPCVARALEKNPDRRYDSCTEFVEKLINPRGSRDEQESGEYDNSTVTHLKEVENLPQLRSISGKDSDTALTHALVVALGGTGALFLNQFRSRVAELGAASPITLHSVMIDTDSMTTTTAGMVDGIPHVPETRALCTRLRSAKQYREAQAGQFGSISRRWIYNVPRNAATGGMRPLGRLALVDHGPRVTELIQSAVEEVKSAAGNSGDIKVYVTTSLTGGTGSGMYLDVVHLMRSCLDEAGLEGTKVISLLTTNRFQGDPSRPLALHVTKSALSELSYFMKPGNSYPGDEGAGWPMVPAARSPLRDAYIIAPSPCPGSPSVAEVAVEYAWADSVVCGEWLGEGRSDMEISNPNVPMARSVGVIHVGDVRDRQTNMLAPYTSKLLLLDWLGNPAESDEDAESLRTRIIRRCGLNLDSIVERAMQNLGKDPIRRRQLLIDYLSGLDPTVLESESLLRAKLLGWLPANFDLEQSEVAVEQCISQIRRELTVRLNDRRLNLSSTLAGMAAIRNHSKELSAALMKQSEELFQNLDQTKDLELQPIGDDDEDASLLRPSQPQMRNACVLGERLTKIIALRVAAAIATSLDTQLAELSEVYSDASVGIAQAIQTLTEDLSWSGDPWKSMEEPLQKQLPKILSELHGKCVASQLMNVINSPTRVSTEAVISDLNLVAAELIRELTGKQVSADPNSDSTQLSTDTELNLTKSLVDITQTVTHAFGCDSMSLTGVKTACMDIGRDSLGVTKTCDMGGGLDNTPTMTIENAVDAVRPPLLECGGKQRLFLVCRDQNEQESLLQELPEETREITTVIQARTSAPMLIHEGQQIELKNVVAWLDSLTGDDGRISSRLSTRCDISWNE